MIKHPYRIAVNQYRRDELDKDVLAAIIRHCAEHGYSASIRELCEATNNNSTSAIHQSLKRLEYDGKITRSKFTARSIQVVSK